MDKKFKYVRAKVYDTQAKDFVFPEDELDEMKNKDSLGITFSGGGTRSASLTLGQLRALNNLGVLKRAKYMCGVSGGSWGTLPFVYLDKNISDKTFLGDYLNPNQITLENLKNVPAQSMANAIANSKILKSLIKDILEGHDLYSRVISRIFLKPFNIGEPNKFFTYNEKTRDEIVKQNSGSKFTADDFYLVNPNPNRPFYIAQGTIENYSFLNSQTAKAIELPAPKNIDRYQFEMTPLYVGINPLYKDSKTFNGDIGGGYVQPHGFDTDAPDNFDTSTKWGQMKLGDKSRIFNLGEIIGTSGAAPAVYDWFTDLVEHIILKMPIFPDFKYWSNFNNPTQGNTKTYDFADGGGLENLGIMPLLKRGVKKIIIFSNCETPLTGSDENTDPPQITDSIPALFRPLKDNYGQKNFAYNVVFDKQIDKYNTLVKVLLQKIKDGVPPIHVDTYKVTQQDFYGIKGGYEVEIMWVYNSPCTKWYAQLQAPVQDFMKDKKNHLTNFPHYKTFLQNPPEIIDLTPEQVNLEAHLSAWIVNESADLIKDFLK